LKKHIRINCTNLHLIYTGAEEMRILIADDESIIRMGLKAILQEMGHVVFAAANGREAMQMARRHLPDMAIFDIKMPYTDGLQAAKTLSKTQPIPILLLTAFSEQDLIEQASELPIQGYLIKPIKPEELTAAIAVAQKRFAESQQLVLKNAKLEQALTERKTIDRAKGKLMKTGLDEEEAYRMIQKFARDNRQSMHDAAEVILNQDKPI
jgi:two-component system, response regulator PdtaR